MKNIILSDPYAIYIKFIKRIKEHGGNASFPEFKDIIDRLSLKLSSPNIIEKVEKNQILKIHYNNLLSKIKFLNIKPIYNDDNFPYKSDINIYFPYRETIRVIYQVVEFFTLFCQKDASPIYHFDRYYYLINMLIEEEDIILIPTDEQLTINDFILTRHIPIYFIGINHENLYFDGYLQSPTEFFIHDINHSRRLFYYLKNSNLIQKGIMKETQNFIENKIKPLIKKSKYLSYFMFELFHEYSIPISKELIEKELLRKPGDLSPYEYITDLNYYNNKLEYDTGNILSGVNNSTLIQNKCNNIVYYHQPYATVFSTLYYKHKYGFYDNNIKFFKKWNMDIFINDLNCFFETFNINKIGPEKIIMYCYNDRRVEIYKTIYEDRKKVNK